MKIGLQETRRIYLSEMTRLMMGNRKSPEAQHYARYGDIVEYKTKPRKYAKHTAKSNVLDKQSGTVGLVIPNGAVIGRYIDRKLHPFKQPNPKRTKSVKTAFRSRGIWLLVFDWNDRYTITLGNQHKFRPRLETRKAISIQFASEEPRPVVDSSSMELTFKFDESALEWQKVDPAPTE